MKCPECGVNVARWERRCPACNYVFPIESDESPSGRKAKPKGNKSKRKSKGRRRPREERSKMLVMGFLVRIDVAVVLALEIGVVSIIGIFSTRHRRIERWNAIGATAIGEFPVTITYQWWDKSGLMPANKDVKPIRSPEPVLKVEKKGDRYLVAFFDQNWEGDAVELSNLTLFEEFKTAMAAVDNQTTYGSGQLPGRIMLTGKRVKESIIFEFQLNPAPDGRIPDSREFKFGRREEPHLPDGYISSSTISRRDFSGAAEETIVFARRPGRAGVIFLVVRSYVQTDTVSDSADRNKSQSERIQQTDSRCNRPGSPRSKPIAVVSGIRLNRGHPCCHAAVLGATRTQADP
jgi:hypothetical protein